MRESNGVASTVDDKKTVESASRSDSTAIDTDTYLGKIGSGVQPSLIGNPGTGNLTTSTGPINSNNTTVPNGNNTAANEDISPEGLL